MKTDSAPVIVRLSEHSHPATKLFCLPYAGGPATLYKKWSVPLQAFDIYGVQIAARAASGDDAVMQRVDSCVAWLIDKIAALTSEPYALFGHSVGALLAFETARALQAMDCPLPVRLFVSGFPAPQLPRRLPAFHDLPLQKLLAVAQRLDAVPSAAFKNQDLIELLLPILRADLALAELYTYSPAPPLPVPITCFGGLADATVGRAQLSEWQDQTSSGFTLKMLPGNHMFVHSAYKRICHEIEREICA